MIELLSLVEHGWGGARRCSLELEGRGVRVEHLIKGRLTPDELAMIAPRPHIRLRAVTRWQYPLWMWAALIARLGRRPLWLLIDRERTVLAVRGWCRLFKILPLVIREDDDGYQLLLDGRTVTLEALLQQAGR